MRIYHTRPAPFNFLNETGMIIILNKRNEVGMGATRLEPVSLPSLRKTHFIETIIPNFKHSLVLALRHFYFFAGNLRACLISVFKNCFLFLRTKNTQNMFDKRVFFVPMCSSCFLKPGFQRTKKWCFSCFCYCSKKKKKRCNQCSWVFSSLSL